MTERSGIAETLKVGAPVVRIVVAGVEGSAPREVGAAMLVMAADTSRSKGTLDQFGEPHTPGMPPHSALSRQGRGLGTEPAASLPSPPAGEGGAPAPGEGDRVALSDLPASTLGTIGGGQLEYEAIAHARSMLEAAQADSSPWRRETRVWPLGPSLGQCCGGSVRILFELYTDYERANITDVAEASLLIRPAEAGAPLQCIVTRQAIGELPLHVARVAKDMLSGARHRQPAYLPARKGHSAYFIEPVSAAAKPLFIYGAGHVGRAIVKAVEDLPFDVQWIDFQRDRFPSPLPHSVREIIASDPAAIASAAPQGAYHLVLTYSHALDLAICHALLTDPRFGFLGLIGSASKHARFIKRLREGGVAEAALSKLTCPIGIGALRGKEPATIAISVAAQLVERLEAERRAETQPREETSGQVGRQSA